MNVDECASNPCRSGSTCRDLVNGHVCICAPGFTGPACDVNIDDCASSPCANRGTCRDGINSYTCNCTASFMGDTCETPYDPCVAAASEAAGRACMNGGQCVRVKAERDPGNDFYCECPNGS